MLYLSLQTTSVQAVHKGQTVSYRAISFRISKITSPFQATRVAVSHSPASVTKASWQASHAKKTVRTMLRRHAETWSEHTPQKPEVQLPNFQKHEFMRRFKGIAAYQTKAHPLSRCKKQIVFQNARSASNCIRRFRVLLISDNIFLTFVLKKRWTLACFMLGKCSTVKSRRRIQFHLLKFVPAWSMLTR